MGGALVTMRMVGGIGDAEGGWCCYLIGYIGAFRGVDIEHKKKVAGEMDGKPKMVQPVGVNPGSVHGRAK